MAVFFLFLVLAAGSSVIIFRLKKKIASLDKTLRNISRKDPVTGVLNRQAFLEVMEVEKERCDRTHKIFSIIVADVDRLKDINTGFGTQAGDAVMAGSAAIFRKHLRVYDILGRWSGDELIILLPETNIATAVACAEKLRKILESEKFRFHESEFSVTMSFGVGICGKTVPVRECIREADSQLLMAKQSGGNRVSPSTGL